MRVMGQLEIVFAFAGIGQYRALLDADLSEIEGNITERADTLINSVSQIPKFKFAKKINLRCEPLCASKFTYLRWRSGD